MTSSVMFLIVGGIGALALGVFGVISIILNYHWDRYGFATGEHIGRVKVIYYGISIILLLAMLLFGTMAITA